MVWAPWHESAAFALGAIRATAEFRLEPWAYLRDLLCLVGDWPEHRLLDLSPLRWAATSREAQVIARLEANPFRQAALQAPA
jgi:hypothetical protein